ncbi:MAG TPA: hypothetical protein VGL81_32275 [Polyangiaceae bacterium]|jgi:hypothetical protein
MTAARGGNGAALAVVVLFALVDRTSWGAEPATCGRDPRPWVDVRTTGELSPSLGQFVDLLRAELASRHIDLCATVDAERPPPLATVEVSSGPDAVTLGVEVRDAVTAKHVSRDVALGGVPADSRPLMIAVAADELLRASWAELALQTAPPPARVVPIEVTRTVTETLAPPVAPSSQRLFLGVDGSLERFGSGTTLYGADARFGASLTPRLAAGLRLGLRSGAAVSAADGDVQPSAWIAGVAGSFTVTPPEYRWGVDAVARFDVEHVSFAATPHGTATGSPGSDFALLGSLGPQAWLRIASTLRVGAEVLAVLPLRPVEATDAHVSVAGIYGAGWSTQLGLWSAL